jgi:hypothetical protein
MALISCYARRKSCCSGRSREKMVRLGGPVEMTAEIAMYAPS